MGIFDFIKSAGKKLGIGGDDDAPEADAVKKELDSHGLGTEKVDVKVDGDKIVLSGVVEDQSIFEKAIVAVGNTLGISKVDPGLRSFTRQHRHDRTGQGLHPGQGTQVPHRRKG